MSVQPWGRDGDKRRYWLIEGQDDTHFRLYRESNPVLKHNTWRSVAGSIDELKGVAEQLGEEGSQAARRLRERILLAIPRFEASEEVCNSVKIYHALPEFITEIRCRNENAAIIATLAKHSLHDQNPAFPSTKDVRGVSG